METRTLFREMLPKGKIFTPFNVIAGLITLAGLLIVAVRFYKGIGSVTNLSQEYPWGLWIGFDVLCGVALAAGGYVIASTVYVFRLEKYYPVLRPAVLTGFLGYFFVVLALIVDLGRPWHLPYPVFYSFGVSSVLFLVAWHVLLYLTCQFIEFCPAVFEWLGLKKIRKIAVGLSVGATIAGVILSTLHQSALGALFLLAPTKVHPLWYSPYIPIFFFISSIIAGLSMVILEGTFSHQIFRDKIDAKHHAAFDDIAIGLGKAGAVVLFTYFFLKLIGLAHSMEWEQLSTPLGKWFLVEMIGFIIIPCILYTVGVRAKNVNLIKFTSFLAILGVVVNRFNISLIAYRWDDKIRYFPHLMEFVVTISIITAGILAFRWIVNRMPVLSEHPEWKMGH